MRTSLSVFCASAFMAVCFIVSVERLPAVTLDIYFLDMNGGGSMLMVTPSGESILIDSGSRMPEHRDADRIFRAAQDAGVTVIDKVITTHFHSDHFGGIGRVAELIPVGRFYDKGHVIPKEEQEVFERLFPFYQQAARGNTVTVRAGDIIPLRNAPSGSAPGLRLVCVAAEKKIAGFDGDIDAPVPGYEKLKPDYSDNARSMALLLSYGDFRFFLPADITWNVEHHLVHPKNLIGKIDLLQVSHHGLNVSNNPLLLKAIDPVVCIFQNGPRKGSHPRVIRTLEGVPSVRGIYQIHFNREYGKEGNVGDDFIANPAGTEGGEYIKVSVDHDQGSYTVTVGSDGQPQTYMISRKK